MIVVADTTPLILLSRIGEVRLLPAMFGEVLILADVKDELASCSMSGSSFINASTESIHDHCRISAAYSDPLRPAR
jgi:predicted nucleic acid-binding protein